MNSSHVIHHDCSVRCQLTLRYVHPTPTPCCVLRCSGDAALLHLQHAFCCSIRSGVSVLYPFTVLGRCSRRGCLYPFTVLGRCSRRGCRKRYASVYVDIVCPLFYSLIPLSTTPTPSFSLALPTDCTVRDRYRLPSLLLPYSSIYYSYSILFSCITDRLHRS